MSARRFRLRPALAGCLAVGILGSGCGGSDDGDGDRRAAITRARRGDGEDAPVTVPVPSSAALVDAACADPSRVVAGPTVPTVGDQLTEVSGVAVVAAAPGTTSAGAATAWVNNDSGDRARVMAVAADGAVTSHDVPGAEAVDWEDIAAGPDGRLYVGDFGDNALARSSIAVYRFTPPDPGSTAPADDVARLTLTYEDGAHNAEALLIDPVDRLIVVVTKGSGTAGVFTVPLAFDDGDQAVLRRIGRVDTAVDTAVGDVGGPITGGDISPDGGAVLIRTSRGALLYRRAVDGPIEGAFDQPGCVVPTGAETQGEAIGFDATGYVTIGEGVDPVLSTFRPAS